MAGISAGGVNLEKGLPPQLNLESKYLTNKSPAT